MELVIPVVVALGLILVAWKVFKGLVKTLALVTILALAALYVIGTFY